MSRPRAPIVDQITQALVKEWLDYDPTTGAFVWKKTTANQTRRAGDTAGTTSKGYTAVGMLGRNYKAHRLAWLWMYGTWPAAIDHIDGIQTNNAIANLREATPMQNARNRRRKGCWFDKKSGLWRAQITVCKENIHLGLFPDAASARAAYVAANLRHFGEFSPYAVQT